jgi:hypothetical protein
MPARARDDVVMFVGPTLASSARAQKLAKSLSLRRPIRRFDVEKVVASRKKPRKPNEPGVIVVVDGVFHDTLAVGHAEIRDALALGWRVWGLSSMGAIRAREMAHLGMRGFGRVYDRFCEDGDFQDDEVALLHEPAPPYRAVSEPLVHLRAAIDHLVARKIVGAKDAREVVHDLKSRWYGERTVRGTIRALGARAKGGVEVVERELEDFERFRWKTLDLEQFLAEEAWRR